MVAWSSRNFYKVNNYLISRRLNIFLSMSLVFSEIDLFWRIEFLGLVNKNIGYPLKFDFQINTRFLFKDVFYFSVMCMFPCVYMPLVCGCLLGLERKSDLMLMVVSCPTWALSAFAEDWGSVLAPTRLLTTITSVLGIMLPLLSSSSISHACDTHICEQNAH